MSKVNFGSLDVSTSQSFTADPRDIKTDENFSRDKISQVHIDGLVTSFNEVGQQQPVVCRKVGEELWLVSGWHRLLTALKIREENENFRIKFNLFKGNEDDAFFANVDENVHRRDLNAADYGKLVYHMIERYNMTHAAIAVKLKCSVPQVGNYLKVYQAPREVRDALANGTIQQTEAIKIAKSKNPVEVLNRLLEGGDSVENVIRESGGRQARTASNLRALCKLYPESPLSKALVEYLSGGEQQPIEDLISFYPIEDETETEEVEEVMENEITSEETEPAMV